MRKYFTISLLLSMMALSACGTRGSLYLPPQQKTPPPGAVSPAVSPVAPSDSDTARPANP
ncbi:MAG: lipoprotein [Candidatus Accumulibacter sp.]|jgi:predicted small lipoprotein YifL|nr:lipoprotein [Accumulibacter sp.]